jgi:hypothetical protein
LGRSRSSYGVVEALRVANIVLAEAIEWEAGPAQTLRTQRKVRLARRLIQLYGLKNQELKGGHKAWWEFLSMLYNQQPGVCRFFLNTGMLEKDSPLAWQPQDKDYKKQQALVHRLTRLFRSISQTEARAVVAELLTAARPNPLATPAGQVEVS